MATDDVAVLRTRNRADDRAALARIRRAPMDRETQLRIRVGMRGQADVIVSIGTGHRSISKTSRARGDGPQGLNAGKNDTRAPQT